MHARLAAKGHRLGQPSITDAIRKSPQSLTRSASAGRSPRSKTAAPSLEQRTAALDRVAWASLEDEELAAAAASGRPKTGPQRRPAGRSRCAAASCSAVVRPWVPMARVCGHSAVRRSSSRPSGRTTASSAWSSASIVMRTSAPHASEASRHWRRLPQGLGPGDIRTRPSPRARRGQVPHHALADPSEPDEPTRIAFSSSAQAMVDAEPDVKPARMRQEPRRGSVVVRRERARASRGSSAMAERDVPR